MPETRPCFIYYKCDVTANQAASQKEPHILSLITGIACLAPPLIIKDVPASLMQL
jgi:hypothetical protein